MYKHHPTLVLGFHACERKVGEQLVNNKARFKSSENNYDWLGHGMYFWENSPYRAEHFGNELKENERLEDPVVVGAAIHLGYCFDLLDYHALSLLKEHFNILKKTSDFAKIKLPQNKGGGDNPLRYLDCAVIQYMHNEMEKKQEITFDSVRGAFWEGRELYPNAGFKEKTHIQVCIRNPNCIKGFFLPRELNERWNRV